MASKMKWGKGGDRVRDCARRRERVCVCFYLQETREDEIWTQFDRKSERERQRTKRVGRGMDNSSCDRGKKSFLSSLSRGSEPFPETFRESFSISFSLLYYSSLSHGQTWIKKK